VNKGALSGGNGNVKVTRREISLGFFLAAGAIRLTDKSRLQSEGSIAGGCGYDENDE
jgi:hypothetical protein